MNEKIDLLKQKIVDMEQAKAEQDQRMEATIIQVLQKINKNAGKERYNFYKELPTTAN